MSQLTIIKDRADQSLGGRRLPRDAGLDRRVVLVDFYWTRDKDPRVPLGHASLLAALKSRTAVDVRAVVRAVNAPSTQVEDVVATILCHTAGPPPDAVDVAIGVYVWGENLVQRVIRSLRGRGFLGRIVLGGPQISYAGAGVDQLYPGADAFVRGYGELALCELASTPGRPPIAGVHYAGEPDRCEQTQIDLSSLPSPWLSGAVPTKGLKFARWETQRGCPYRCNFCQHREAGARLAFRELDRERLGAEVALLCAAKPEEIAVLDPVFNVGEHANWVLQRLITCGFRDRLSLQCRAELVTTAFLDLAQRLNVCLEFGLQTIHPNEAKAVDRRNDVRKVEAALAEVRARGIDHEVSLIFGLPEQTLASFEQSVTWCLERRVPIIKAFPLMLLRGTRLDLERERWGLEEDESEMPCVVASNTFSREDWEAMNRLSKALLDTEGHHSGDLEELRRLAPHEGAGQERWRPAEMGSRA